MYQSDDIKQITWNGTGDGMNKAIACAEIMKKRFKVNLRIFGLIFFPLFIINTFFVIKNLYQINKIGYST